MKHKSGWYSNKKQGRYDLNHFFDNDERKSICGTKKFSKKLEAKDKGVLCMLCNRMVQIRKRRKWFH
jgi:hypothetical protein